MIQKSLYTVAKEPLAAISAIAENMLRLRPETRVVYRPYYHNQVFYMTAPLKSMRVDLKRLYPQARCGDRAYVGAFLETSCDCDGAFVLFGDADVFLSGERVYASEGKRESERTVIPIRLKKGRNRLLLRCVCRGDEFGISFHPSTRYYPGMWARDYLLHIRVTSPIPEYEGEDGVGISRLYSTGEAFDGRYAFPRVSREYGVLDFGSLCRFSGEYAYAASYAIADTRLRLAAENDFRCYLNGREITNKTELVLKQHDYLLCKIRLERGSGKLFYSESAALGIPGLKSKRPGGVKWLTLGALCQAEAEAAEREIRCGVDLKKVYDKQDGTSLFWGLEEEGTTLRPYVDSCFYSQWFYAVMVGHYGLLQAALALGNDAYRAYFTGSMENMACYFEYMQYERRTFSDTAFMPRATSLKDLDSIGSIGMNLAELCFLGENEAAGKCIDRLAEAMEANIKRLDDGAFYRGKTMWADDVFMSCPFLVRLGILKGDSNYFAECLRQLRGFYNRLYRKEKHIFSHIFFVEEGIPNGISWGRGNGWVLLSMADALEKIPQNMDGYRWLEKTFCEFAGGVVRLQDDSGLWRQILDEPESYLETSCSGMFLLGLVKGIRLGLLEARRYRTSAEKAYEGLLKYAADEAGNLFGVCRGSGCSMEKRYYLELGTVENDDHGTGIILWAFAEMQKLREDFHENI